LSHTSGEIRAFSNVCRHRAGSVAEGCGNRQTLQCAYHGWTYGLDGRLLGTPEFDGVEDFDRQRFGLVPLPAATWGPFVFVNTDGKAPPLAQTLGEIVRETDGLGLEGLRLCERRIYDIACNWKVYVDNYLEGYHVPMAHPGLFRELDYAEYAGPGVPEVLARTIAFGEQTQVEDIALCEAVQIRLHSRTYDRGRFSVQRENGVHHFQGLVHEFLTSAAWPAG
jgi:phenylpropionate dioxygenase-like ring-hydroxylating dioxygenase large terminal subunit